MVDEEPTPTLTVALCCELEHTLLLIPRQHDCRLVIDDEGHIDFPAGAGWNEVCESLQESLHVLCALQIGMISMASHLAIGNGQSEGMLALLHDLGPMTHVDGLEGAEGFKVASNLIVFVNENDFVALC